MHSPNGRYECNHTKSFPHGSAVFTLALVKVDAPNWDFTFSDIGDDLSAIFEAAQYFDSPVYGVPQMDIEAFRYRNGHGGASFLASQGRFALSFLPTANVSVT